MKLYNSKNKINIKFKLNDKIIEKEVEPRLLLSDFLRYNCGQTGTHVGCEHGICGACTILFNEQPIRSCLMLAAQIRDSEILTIEGVANDSKYNDLREAFKKHHALQCGFCTPGFFITIISILNENVYYNEEDLREKLSGNLCRCTGYTGIILAVSEVIKKRHSKEFI